MNINRDYLLILDVKSGNLTVPTMYFINTDRGTSNIYLQLIVKNTDIKVSPLEKATNYKVKANIVKSGGIIKFIEGVLVNEEDAIYEFNLPVDCINLSGAYRIEFEVSADVGEKQESITSFSTKYYVKRSILAEINEEIEDGDDYPLIVKLLAKIEELEKDSETRWIAENERIANEELRVQAESERLARYTLAEEKEAQRVIDEEARINAENERLAKEEERIAKEIDRVAKETERLNEEEIRKGSEITRVLNETTRVTNEEARVEAENIRLPKYLEADEKEQARLSAEEQRIANENIRVANENDRISAESIRDSKEADRLNSEIFRLTNESNRLENETLRTNNEATRINSELTRVDNERNRVVSEKARVNSEEIRRTNENNRKIYESNREKAEQLRESNEVIRQEGYTLMTEQMNNLGATLSQYALISYVDDEISKIQVTGGGESYTHPSTHPASMITGLSTVATTGDYNDLSDKPNIPTKTSQLTNDSGYITEAELNGKGYATTSQIPTVPTNVSAFTNDANYATETYVASKIAEAQLGGGSESSGTFIDDTTTATDKTWSSSKIDSQIKDIVNVADLAQDGSNIYIKDSNGNKVGNGIIIQASSTSTSSTRLYNTEPIGELFDEPTECTYLAWPAGNLKYDKNIDKYVCIVNAADKHIFTTLKQYICFINPNTFEVSELTEIVVTDTTLDQKAICNFAILDDGSYMMIALVGGVNHKIVSSDNGTTWTDAGVITGNTSQHFWAIYKLSNGRLIGSIDVANKGLWYSDNEGDSWTNVIPSGTPGNYNAEGCIIELSQNNLMCIARKNMGGNTDGDKAIISYSTDNGTTWSAWTDSTTINMNASSCTSVVHDGIVELFAGNRWYNTTSMYANTGKYGAITHYTATLENALNDNFTFESNIVYSNGSGSGDVSQDFHCPCVAIKDKDMLLVYFDRINDGSASATNYHFIRGSLNQLSYKPNDAIVSKGFSYSSKYTEILFNNMLEKINTLQYALSQIPGSGVDVPSGSVIYTFEWASDSGTYLHLTKNSPVLGNSYGLNSANYCGEKDNGEFNQQIFAIPFTKSNFAMYANVKFKEYNAIMGIYDTDGFHGVHCRKAVNWENGDGTFSITKSEWINNYHTLKIVKNNNKYTMYVDDVEYTCPVCTSSDITNNYSIIESKTYYKVNETTGKNTTETIVPSPTIPYMYLYTGNMGVYIAEFKIGEWDS